MNRFHWVRYALLVLCAATLLSAEEPQKEPPVPQPRQGRPDPAQMTPEERLEICDAFFQRMSRRISFEFVKTPLQEALTFTQTLCHCSMILDPRATATGAGQLNITIRAKNTPYAVVFGDMLGKVGLTWTIGSEQKLHIYIANPELVKEMDAKYPEIAKAVAAFKIRIRAEAEKASAKPKDGPAEPASKTEPSLP